jgi:hypothetical protein
MMGKYQGKRYQGKEICCVWPWSEDETLPVSAMATPNSWNNGDFMGFRAKSDRPYRPFSSVR